MVDFRTVEFDDVGMAEFLEEGDLMDNGFYSTCVLLDGELGGPGREAGVWREG